MHVVSSLMGIVCIPLVLLGMRAQRSEVPRDEAFDVFLLEMRDVFCFWGNLMTCDLTDALQVQLVKAQWWDLPLLTEAELVHFGFPEFMTNPCQK